MGSGFQITRYASVIFLGLILVAFAVGYSAALSRLKKAKKYESFTNWFWFAGLALVIYFAYCFLASISRYSYRSLLVMTIVTWVILAAMHVLEILSLYRLSTSNWQLYRRVFSLETVAVVALFVVFTVLMAWVLFFTSGITARESMLLNAVTYVLALGAIRALVLIHSAFSVLGELAIVNETSASTQ